MNKENSSRVCNSNRSSYSLHHPSQQSKSSVYKPSIKVGYKIIPAASQQKRTKRKIQPNHTIVQKANCRKMNTDTINLISGRFVNSQYIRQSQKNEPNFQKKGVIQCRDKYQSGEGVKQNMKNQVGNVSRRSNSIASVSSSRSKNQLPSYQNTGIKDIMQYHHALPYRETPVTIKCTSTTALSRFCKFQDLHQYDFRKRPQILR